MERNVVLIALFAALIAILGIVPQFTLISGVPISAQSLGIMLCGTVLGARRGALAVLLFLALVALGLPLLSGGRGGIGVFFGPTAGFLVGFPIAAFVTGHIVERLVSLDLKWAAMLGAFFGGIIAMYVPGIFGMAIVLDKSLLVATGFALPFIPGDILKVVLAGFLTAALARARPAAILWRS